MPHLTIEYSRNLTASVDVSTLLDDLHSAVISTGVFEVAAVRTRGVSREEYVVADGASDNAFVDVVLRIGQGRDHDTQQRVIDTVFASLRSAVSGSELPVAVSFELQHIDTELSRRDNPLHRLLAPAQEA